jgi:predicted dehydrogenase
MTDSGRRLRLGMIGGGPGSMIGPIHRIAARIDDRYALTAGAFSSNPERAAQAGRDYRVAPDRSYADWREMVAREAARTDDRLDVVSICTPNHLHRDPAIACLEAGFHVICDKPLATTLADAEAIADAAERSGQVFVLTHNYSAYPMVRQARAMVAAGLLGRLRIARVQYAQSWLTKTIEAQGNKQASWRTDAARAGLGGALGDIGTHAYQLAEFVLGLRATDICADLTAFGAGRDLDDNVHMMLAYPGGVKGTLWATQVAPGQNNGVRLAVYGEDAGIEWFQEQPNQLRYTRHGEPTRILERGGPDANLGAYVTRAPDAHPEGFLEAFAQIYSDAAELICARLEGREPDAIARLAPGAEDGVEGVRFVLGAVESSRRHAWLPRAEWTASAR